MTAFFGITFFICYVAYLVLRSPLNEKQKETMTKVLCKNCKVSSMKITGYESHYDWKCTNGCRSKSWRSFVTTDEAIDDCEMKNFVVGRLFNP